MRSMYANAGIGAGAVFDFRLMYAFFQARGLRATPAAVARLPARLGRSPRRFEDFVAETARSWMA